MKIQITKQTNINGNRVNAGEIIDTKYVAKNDVSILLSIGSAVEYVEKEQPPAPVETAVLSIKTEQATTRRSRNNK